MKKSEIKVGGYYTAKVNGKLVTVLVDSINESPLNRQSSGGSSSLRYEVTNLSTNRKTTFRSAAKFRSPATTLCPPSNSLASLAIHLLYLLRDTPHHLDDLASATVTSRGRVAAALLGLEMDRKVRRLPGDIFESRCDRQDSSTA